jgi:thymidylate synthase ThyX
MSTLAKQARKLNPPLTEKYSKTDDPNEEKAAQVAMEHFVTSPQGSIYAIKPIVPELFSALLKARYSRTQLFAKELLWREFVSQKEGIDWAKIEEGLNHLDEVFNFQKAEGMAERILLQYGDDSVFELGGAHLFMDRISMIATKVVEDARIGLSPLEKSTRYVIFDQKNNDGDYAFFKDPQVMASKHKALYLKTNRALFDFYAEAVQKLMDYFRKQIPLEAQEFPDFTKANKSVLYGKLKDEKSLKAAKFAYETSIKAKACDVARVILPASTLTNVGLFGNARAYGYLFTKMQAMNIAELQMIGEEGTTEIKKVLPKFLDVVDNSHGQEFQKYLKKTDEALRKRAATLLKNLKPETVERVELVQLHGNLEVNIAAALLYPYSNLPLKQLIWTMEQHGKEVVGEVIRDALKYRTNRRHKPPRGFEIAGYELVYDILGNFGIFRDMHRQRMLTQQHQAYTTEHGFDMPEEFKLLKLEEQFNKAMADADATYQKMKPDFSDEAQYVTTLANYTRWYMGMNLREAFWVTELRSVPQGHFSYRTVAQDMFIKASERYPFLKELKAMNEQYVDMSDRSKNLERMEAMQRIQTKLAAIEDKYS